MRLVHRQQAGVEIAHAGDEIGFVRNDTLETVGKGAVCEVNSLNKTFTRLKFSTTLPPEIGAGFSVENLDWQPDVTIRGCTTRGNRARGFLLSSAGKILVENNLFHNPGAAILVAGDANFWLESGAVHDLTIRGNTFDNCLYGVWGRAVIDINPEIAPEKQEQNPRYHRNIHIENNHFRTFDNRLLRAQCVDGLTISGNTIEISEAYPLQAPKSELFEVAHCSNVLIENNTFASHFDRSAQ